MPIPESQLETWSHVGSVQQSSSTYQTVKGALEHSSSSYFDKSFSVFLQGSYGNDTNIYAESDVDTVIRLDSIFRYDVDTLPPDQKAAFLQNTGAPGYSYSDFKLGVIQRLNNAFLPTNVVPGNKAIQIKPGGARRKADVVSCYEYRRYTRYYNNYDCNFTSGIIFPSTSSGEIINFPQLHSQNLTLKHQATNSWFKPMVRIFKNARSRMVDGGVISSSLAPSYYVEGMLYNVPESAFGVSWGNSFCESINWLLKANSTSLMCAHGQYRLLGNSNVQWTSSSYDQFLRELVKLWNTW